MGGINDAIKRALYYRYKTGSLKLNAAIKKSIMTFKLKNKDVDAQKLFRYLVHRHEGVEMSDVLRWIRCHSWITGVERSPSLREQKNKGHHQSKQSVSLRMSPANRLGPRKTYREDWSDTSDSVYSYDSFASYEEEDSDLQMFEGDPNTNIGARQSASEWKRTRGSPTVSKAQKTHRPVTRSVSVNCGNHSSELTGDGVEKRPLASGSGVPASQCNGTRGQSPLPPPSSAAPLTVQKAPFTVAAAAGTPATVNNYLIPEPQLVSKDAPVDKNVPLTAPALADQNNNGKIPQPLLPPSTLITSWAGQSRIHSGPFTISDVRTSAAINTPQPSLTKNAPLSGPHTLFTSSGTNLRASPALSSGGIPQSNLAAPLFGQNTIFTSVAAPTFQNPFGIPKKPQPPLSFTVELQPGRSTPFPFTVPAHPVTQINQVRMQQQSQLPNNSAGPWDSQSNRAHFVPADPVTQTRVRMSQQSQLTPNNSAGYVPLDAQRPSAPIPESWTSTGPAGGAPAAQHNFGPPQPHPLSNSDEPETVQSNSGRSGPSSTTHTTANNATTTRTTQTKDSSAGTWTSSPLPHPVHPEVIPVHNGSRSRKLQELTQSMTCIHHLQRLLKSQRPLRSKLSSLKDIYRGLCKAQDNLVFPNDPTSSASSTVSPTITIKCEEDEASELHSKEESVDLT